MKEYTSQTGGRYTYIDDIMNLQELALAFASIFDGCDNFIISGCQVSGTTLSAGFVYINGKIRYCAGASGISKWPIYLYESNTIEKVSYADSSDKVGRNVYGCAVASSVPNIADTLTGSVPQSIKVTSDGSALRLKDAFFGKYALVIDGSYSSQSVQKDVSFGGGVTVSGGVNAASLSVVSGTSKATISYDASGALVIQSVLSGKSPYKIVITSDGFFQFYINNTLLVNLGSSGMYLGVSLSTSLLHGGNITIKNDNIYNGGAMSDTGVLNINMVGYNAGTTYYRNTIIGNGKNEAVLSINGKTKSSLFYGDVTISTSTNVSLSLLHSTLAKTDKTLIDYIAWKDKNQAVMARIGYIADTDYDWYIHNDIGNVIISNDVYISGKLYVSGIELLSALVGSKDFTDALSGKANTADVYSKQSADTTFVKRTEGIAAFVTQAGGGETGKASVRTAIGAASVTDLNNAVIKSQLFKDIVSEGLPSTSASNYASSLETRKRALCENIGAAYKDDVQTSVKDTGWIAITVQNCGITTKLYVRQVGHVVSIQGQLHTHHSGTIFTLPNTVDPPQYEIGYSHNKDGNWHCTILGGSRDCKVDYCNNGCSEYIGFLMTYIV